MGILGLLKMTETKYEFKMTQHDGTVVILQGNKERLPELFEDFVQWLSGCGYSNKTIANLLGEPE